MAWSHNPSNNALGPRWAGPTVDDLPLALNDLLAEAAVLLQAAHGLAAVTQSTVAEQSVRLHLGVFHLQLVHATQQAEHLALFLGSDAPRQRLFQAPAPRSQLPAALLQCQLRGSPHGSALGQFHLPSQALPSGLLGDDSDPDQPSKLIFGSRKLFSVRVT